MGFFLRVDDVHAAYERTAAAGVRSVTATRTGTYGQVAVFLDVVGRWTYDHVEVSPVGACTA